MYTEAQLKYIEDHSRKPEENIAVAEIARVIADEANRKGIEVYPEQAWKTAFIMNLGETNKNISFIYDEEYGWKEEERVNIVNKLHGKCSVAMAEKAGINLTEEQKKAIESHSTGDYFNTLAEVIKIAEICQMTKLPRIYNGVKKEAASTWEEVRVILEEDKGLSPELIDIAEDSYGKKKFFDNNLTYRQKLALFVQRKDVLMKLPFVRKFVRKELYVLPERNIRVSSAEIGKERLAKVLRVKNMPKISESNLEKVNKV